MAGMLKDLTDQELIVIQNTGVTAFNFLKNNDFYVSHLKPAIEAKLKASERDGDWSPGKDTNAEVIVAYNAYNSGRKAGIGIISTVCQDIINRGNNAAQELERRAKKADKKEKGI